MFIRFQTLLFLVLFIGSSYAGAVAVVSAAPTKVSAAKVFFIEPKDGAVVAKIFKVKFGSEGLKIKAAGQDVDEKTSGHYHVLVDQGFFPDNAVIPADAAHLHYGKGQTEAELTLPPGTHKLTLQFADGAHRSGGERLSQTITVNVK